MRAQPLKLLLMQRRLFLQIPTALGASSIVLDAAHADYLNFKKMVAMNRENAPFSKPSEKESFKMLTASTSHFSLESYSVVDVNKINLPSDGKKMLEMAIEIMERESPSSRVLVLSDCKLTKDFYLEPWLDKLGVTIIYCKGSMVVDGNFWNDSVDIHPLLIVEGDLHCKNWLKGGAGIFVGGDVVATGLIIGEYDDGVLFVGGGLSAGNGYIKRRKPYPDLPDITNLHQIKGKILGPRFDLLAENISQELVDKAFVPEVANEYIGMEYGGFYANAEALIERSMAGKPIWNAID